MGGRMHLIVLLFLTLLWRPLPAAEPAVAFLYGRHPPRDELQAFDWVIVQPDSDLDPAGFRTRQTTLFAYVSVGEMAPTDPGAGGIPPACLIGDNPVWRARIVDQSNPACRSYYIERLIAPLWERGFRGFFLDTLDSYEWVSRSQRERRRHEAGLVALIRTIKQRFPTARLILNRGFPFLAQVADQVEAVAAESLYRRWNQRRQRYEAVPENDRRWLLQRLRQVQRLGLRVIVIDYLPAGERQQARQLAGKIRHQGFIPWIGNATLDWLGVGLREVVPRKILAVTDAEDIYLAKLMMNLSLPLNFLGYSVRPVAADVALPQGPLEGIYAGIILWLEKPAAPETQERLWRWLLRRKAEAVPIVFAGGFGFPPDRRHLASFGLTITSGHKPAGRITHVSADPAYFGFETPPLPDLDSFFPLRADSGGAVAVLQLENDHGQWQDAAAVTPWGGYVLDPYLVMESRSPLEGEIQTLWQLNPFTFLRAALRHGDIPVPDITTRSGRRVLTIHIDGDGFVNRSRVPGHYGRFAGQVMETEILRRYPLPTNVSFIAAEFTDDGLYPRLAPALRRIARRILALPWVEPATHTYSHPFEWQALERHPELSAGTAASAHLPYGYNLKVPGYRFDPWMETVGSARLIEKLLAPPGKRVTTVNWSGDTNPGIPSLSAACRAGLLNINGGSKPVLRRRPSLTNLPGNGVWKGACFQVFAPQANENDFTQLWQGPYFGFRNLIHSLQLTGSPRRLKAAHIYYHFYSAERPAALKALKTVYRWALGQPLHPLRTSTYIRSVLDFERLVIARQDGHWLVRNYGDMLTLRLPPSLGHPNLASSRNVAGYTRAGNGEIYVHLVPGSEARLALGGNPAPLPRVETANATVRRYEVQGSRVRIALDGEVPVTVRIHQPSSCRRERLAPRPRSLIKPKARHTTTYRFHARHAEFTFRCRS